MKRLYLAVVLLYLISCQPEFLTPEELTAYVSDEENGVRKSITIGGTKVDVTYRPTDLLIHQEVSGESLDTTAFRLLQEKYDNYYYFILSLSNNNRESLHSIGGNSYSELVETLSFHMNDYVTMTTASRDTIPVGDFILNRTFGMSSSTDLLFVFSRQKAKGKEWIQFNLNEFGLGLGNRRFRFSTKDLLNLPRIKFEVK